MRPDWLFSFLLFHEQWSPLKWIQLRRGVSRGRDCSIGWSNPEPTKTRKCAVAAPTNSDGKKTNMKQPAVNYECRGFLLEGGGERQFHVTLLGSCQMLANKQTTCRNSVGFKKLSLHAIGEIFDLWICVYAIKEHKRRCSVWWKGELWSVKRADVVGISLRLGGQVLYLILCLSIGDPACQEGTLVSVFLASRHLVVHLRGFQAWCLTTTCWQNRKGCLLPMHPLPEFVWPTKDWFFCVADGVMLLFSR